MPKDITCPNCRKRLARAKDGAELVPMRDGPILLWCNQCRTEIPFALALQKKNISEPLSR